MNYFISKLISSTILIAVIIGIVRWKKVKKTHHLFIVFVSYSAFNEIISLLSAQFFKNNAVVNNIYVLVSSIILLFLFKSWWYSKQKNKVFYILTLLLIIVWCWEFLFYTKIWRFSSYFRIFSAFIIVLLSLRTISLLINSNQHSLIKHSTFIICIAFILFFTVKILLEIFYMYGLFTNPIFGGTIYFLIHYVVVPTNILYALAIIRMPLKPKFMLRQVATS